MKPNCICLEEDMKNRAHEGTNGWVQDLMVLFVSVWELVSWPTYGPRSLHEDGNLLRTITFLRNREEGRERSFRRKKKKRRIQHGITTRSLARSLRFPFRLALKAIWLDWWLDYFFLYNHDPAISTVYFLGRPALLSPQLRTIPFSFLSLSLSRARERWDCICCFHTLYSYTTLTRDFICLEE